RDPPRLLGDELARERVAGPRGGEHGTRLVGCAQRRLAGEARRELLGELGQGARAGIDLLERAGDRVVELAGGPVAAAVQLTVQHEPRAHARADREEQVVVDAARDAAPLLAESGEVDVVLEPDR